MRDIDRLLLEEKDEDTKKILRALKHLSNDAHLMMMGEYQVFGPKYHQLQRTPIWKKGKQLVIQYKIIKGKIKCPICNTQLNFQKCTLHHILSYDTLELFTPTKVQLIHNRCHQKHHKK